MLQDLFDEMDVLQKTRDGRVDIYIREWKDATTSIQQQYGIGTQAVMLRFVWKDEHIFLDTHCFVMPTGELGASRKLDPKGIRYQREMRLLAVDVRPKLVTS